MSNIDLLKTYARYCKFCGLCVNCEINALIPEDGGCDEAILNNYEEVCDILEKFNEEHPLKTNRDALLEVFPQVLEARDDENSAGDDELPAVLPCKIDPDWINGHCPEYYPFDCSACRQMFWSSEYKGNKDEDE